ncbi:MAG: glutamyl-tRNA reductase [Myxococcales bacterium]|nr:glutamyl-tRNA reductase [Myxococcales bacterium]
MIVVIGVSHRTAPVEVREKFAASSDALPQVLARLSSRQELRETLFLSTCNRVEVFAASKALPPAEGAIHEVLAERAGIAPADIAPYLYRREGKEAVRHIFRVAASLDSMVLGEPQILGQVKDAFEAANAAGTLGSYLGRCVHRAFGVAKRVRSETSLGAGLVSISSVAIDLAKKIFGELAGHSVLLVGAGEMAEQAAKSLGKDAREIRVCNRSYERGTALAQSIGGEVAPWSALEPELVRSDVVIVSTASPGYVITKETLKRVMRVRRGRTLFVIDISVPRNVEPNAHTIDNVFVFNVDDLEGQVAENMKLRQSEVSAAEAIVEEELADFEAWARSLDVQPAIVALRAKTRGILMAELERSLGTRLKHLGEGERAALTQMVESATNKLLHEPTTRLRASASSSSSGELVQALKHLFELPDVGRPDEPAPEAGDGPERIH